MSTNKERITQALLDRAKQSIERLFILDRDHAVSHICADLAVGYSTAVRIYYRLGLE